MLNLQKYCVTKSEKYQYFVRFVGYLWTGIPYLIRINAFNLIYEEFFQTRVCPEFIWFKTNLVAVVKA